MKCSVKHAKYQPIDKEWRCPSCDADNKSFYIEEPVTDSECTLLHEGDGLYCFECRNGWSGKQFAAKLQKEKNLVPCKHCKGKGLVKAS